MAVNSVSSAAQALIDATNSSSSAASSSNAMTDAQNRFLKLLTTQLKNQDPLMASRNSMPRCRSWLPAAWMARHCRRPPWSGIR